MIYGGQRRMKEWIFSNQEKVADIKRKIIETTNESVEKLYTSVNGISFLSEIKFGKVGFDPLLEEPTNFIEQVNQTFTYIVSLEAIEFLLVKYPNKSFRVNFGVKAGYDIESLDNSVICECFATTTPDSNKKLESDVKRLYQSNTVADKYVIYYAKHDKPKHKTNLLEKYKGINISSLKTLNIQEE